MEKETEKDEIEFERGFVDAGQKITKKLLTRVVEDQYIVVGTKEKPVAILMDYVVFHSLFSSYQAMEVLYSMLPPEMLEMVGIDKANIEYTH